MSAWTVVTLQADPTAVDDTDDPWAATADLVATVDADPGVRRWTVQDSHVYAELHASHFETVEQSLREWAPLLSDAAVLRANDTSDLGDARYYPEAGDAYTDHYTETHADDNPTGQVACAVLTARHGIVVRDPFHNRPGRLDDEYLADGEAWEVASDD